MKKTLVNPGFELTNLQRRYLGLGEVMPHWEKVPVKNSHIILYFDGDIIRKMFTSSEDCYYETDLLEHTADNRTVLLPKTKRGKPRKLKWKEAFPPSSRMQRYGREASQPPPKRFVRNKSGRRPDNHAKTPEFILGSTPSPTQQPRRGAL
ncbi:MAG: hypothetical protein K2L45_02895 [Muribaculaceae bacterium]|nr:hypothetical protein [Muribaculaceae bacterium]